MFNAKVNNNIQISAKIIRADGSVEDLGVVASTENKNVFSKVKEFLKNLIKK